MNDTAVFIDVNIPMYAAGRDHPHKAACVWVLGEVAAGRRPAVIDSEVVQEVLYRYGALGEWSIATAMASSLMDLIPDVLPVTRDDLETAVALFATYGPQGVKARDVLHAAVMRTHGITDIISTDKHFDRLPDIVRLDPQALYDASVNHSH